MGSRASHHSKSYFPPAVGLLEQRAKAGVSLGHVRGAAGEAGMLVFAARAPQQCRIACPSSGMSLVQADGEVPCRSRPWSMGKAL